MTLYAGVKSAIEVKTAPEQHLDLFSYVLPFVGFIVDASIKRAFLISARVPFMMVKLMSILCYLVVYVMAIQKSEDVRFYYLMIVAQVMFPAFCVLYCGLLLKGKLK